MSVPSTFEEIVSNRRWKSTIALCGGSALAFMAEMGPPELSRLNTVVFWTSGILIMSGLAMFVTIKHKSRVFTWLYKTALLALITSFGIMLVAMFLDMRTWIV